VRFRHDGWRPFSSLPRHFVLAPLVAVEERRAKQIRLFSNLTEFQSRDRRGAAGRKIRHREPSRRERARSISVSTTRRTTRRAVTDQRAHYQPAFERTTDAFGPFPRLHANLVPRRRKAHGSGFRKISASACSAPRGRPVTFGRVLDEVGTPRTGQASSSPGPHKPGEGTCARGVESCGRRRTSVDL